MAKLNQLENALALNAHGNFYRAANALGISQPALSRSIQKLEQSLGAILFERLPDRVVPTEYGKLVLSRAKTIVSETEQLHREITMVQSLQTGHIRIAMGVYAAELSGNQAIAELVRLHPEVSCQSSVYFWRLIISQVLDRSIDLGVAEISTLRESDKKLVAEPLGRHSLVFFCRKGHPLLARKKLSKANLNAYPLATVNIPPRVAKLFPGKTHISHETGDRVPFIEVDSLTAAGSIIEGSNAFGTATPLQLEPWLESGRFEVLPYRRPWLKLDYGFIYLRNHTLLPAVKLFMELARDIETELAQRNRELMKQVI